MINNVDATPSAGADLPPTAPGRVITSAASCNHLAAPGHGSALTFSRRVFLSGAVGGFSGGVDRPAVAEPSRVRELERWRAAYPALSAGINGRPIIYFDNAATTHRAHQALEAEAEYSRSANANPANSMHALARRSFERYEAARSTVARFLKARAREEVVWVSGATDAINLVAHSWALPRLGAGDEILLTSGEHYSNLLPWQAVAAATGAQLRFIVVHRDGSLDLDGFERLLTHRTRLLSVPHVSHVTGAIYPVRDLCRRAHNVGAVVLVDGAQSAPHLPIDVQELECDFFVLSAHKMSGPMGVGALWARREILEGMPPYRAGGHTVRSATLNSADYLPPPARFEAGSPDVAGAVGWEGAIRSLGAYDRELVRDHAQALCEHALRRLTAVPSLKLLGPAAVRDRVGIFSFTHSQLNAAALARHLDERGFAVRSGDLAASHLLNLWGIGSAIRVSLYFYNSHEEIDALAECLASLGQGELKHLR